MLDKLIVRVDRCGENWRTCMLGTILSWNTVLLRRVNCEAYASFVVQIGADEHCAFTARKTEAKVCNVRVKGTARCDL